MIFHQHFVISRAYRALQVLLGVPNHMPTAAYQREEMLNLNKVMIEITTKGRKSLPR